MKRGNAGYAYAFGAAFMLANVGILIQVITSNYLVPALVTALWRDVFSAIILLAALLLIKPALLRIEKKQIGFLALFGLVFAIFNIFWTISVVHNGASVATVLVYSSTPFTAILGWWLLHEKLGLPKFAAILLSLTGCTLASLAGSSFQSSWLGLTIGIGSGLCYAIYTLLGRRASQRQLNPWTTSFYSFVFASLYLLAFNLLPIKLVSGQAASPAELLFLGNRWLGWFYLFLLALGPTVLGFGFYNNSLVTLPSSVANMILTLEPPITAIIAFFIFGERLLASQVLGGLLVVVGVVLMRYFEDRQARGLRSAGAEAG